MSRALPTQSVPDPGNPSDQMGSAASNPEFGVLEPLSRRTTPASFWVWTILEDFWKTSGRMLLVKGEINTANGAG